MPFPDWLAVMVVVPAPTIVTVDPDTVATAVLLLEYETVRPLDAVAVRLNGALPKTLPDRLSLKVIVWAVSDPVVKVKRALALVTLPPGPVTTTE